MAQAKAFQVSGVLPKTPENKAALLKQ